MSKLKRSFICWLIIRTNLNKARQTGKSDKVCKRVPSLYGRVSMILVRHNKRMGTEDLSFYHPILLRCLDQMLTVMELSQLLVSSSKTVKPIIPRGTR